MKATNKGRRQELTNLKFKKRLKLRGLKPMDGKLYCFKTSSVPCSCAMCRGPKFRDHRSKSKKISDLQLSE